jgi:hypothetical protein
VISEDTGQRILSSWVNKVLLKVGRKYSSFKESTATEKQWALAGWLRSQNPKLY